MTALWKTENYRDRNHISGCQGLGVERGVGLLRDMRELLE